MRASIAYAGRGVSRPRYYANDHGRDRVEIVPVAMDIRSARGAGTSLDREGFELISHRSAVRNFEDRAEVQSVHRPEVMALICALTGADLVVVSSPGILRFSERSHRSGALHNSRPARFVHVDVSDTTAATFAHQAAPPGRALRRFVHYNLWRAISVPPQDVPLAVCEAASVEAGELIAADAVFDAPDRPEWSFEGLVVAHSPRHRWCWFPDMHSDEVLVFKTHDSDPGHAHCVPHVAFDNPLCDPAAAPRASIEMRAIALWLQ